ncbi:hypothetical protein lbkm_0950 [Lachnospiraceae bacterium KM106-2]|nr:hypothetical protein lbkm_0950 [Lachnospiraceae bacterium KM106-2]
MVMYHGTLKQVVDTKYGVNKVNTINEQGDNKYTDDAYNVTDIDVCNAASNCDCTGLMRIPPQNEEEAESYQDIYSFGPPMI